MTYICGVDCNAPADIVKKLSFLLVQNYGGKMLRDTKSSSCLVILIACCSFQLYPFQIPGSWHQSASQAALNNSNGNKLEK